MEKCRNKKILIIISVIMIMIASFSVVHATSKNNNPMLKAIKVNGYDIEPAFEMFTTEYVITVGEEVEKIEIEAIPDDNNATVNIVGNNKLESGRNVIEIKVTAEDGQAKQSYFLYVTKGDAKKANANLKEIKIENSQLAPSFNKNTINYAFEYPESLEKVEIQAIPEDEDAKVEIIGNENLKEATQNIEIKVTAEDNQTIKTYYLIAKKAGIEVESPIGDEPETKTQLDKEENENNEATETQEEIKEETKQNEIIYFIVAIFVIVIIVILAKKNREGGKRKNEK